VLLRNSKVFPEKEREGLNSIRCTVILFKYLATIVNTTVEKPGTSQVEFFCKEEGDMLKKLRCLPKSRFFSSVYTHG
jgi:hypothetical protein